MIRIARRLSCSRWRVRRRNPSIMNATLPNIIAAARRRRRLDHRKSHAGVARFSHSPNSFHASGLVRSAGKRAFLRDTVNVPFWDGKSAVYPMVKLRMDFRDPNAVGTFIYHCHLLEHEDGGMMGTIRVETSQRQKTREEIVQLLHPQRRSVESDLTRVSSWNNNARVSTLCTRLIPIARQRNRNARDAPLQTRLQAPHLCTRRIHDREESSLYGGRGACGKSRARFAQRPAGERRRTAEGKRSTADSRRPRRSSIWS